METKAEYKASRSIIDEIGNIVVTWNGFATSELVCALDDYFKKELEVQRAEIIEKLQVELCNVIVNSPPETTIKKRIESLSFSLASRILFLK